MGDKTPETIIFIIGITLLCGFLLIFVLPQIMQEVRGPSVDLTVNAKFDSNGNLSQYKIIFDMPDAYSYDRYLQYANSQGNSTIREYLLRGIPANQIFEYNYDQRNLKITFWSTQPFSPNNVTNTIRIDKQEDIWRYEDSSFEMEYFIPDSYINSITYTLNCPTEVRNSNADSRGKFLAAKKLTWTIDRQKDAIGSSTRKAVIPTFYAEVKVPEAPEVIVVPGFGPVIAFIGIFMIALLERKKNG